MLGPNTISVHQSQYLPWLGYFDKIDKSDAFVFLDKVQYKKREYQNRNKIRTKEGWIWLTVPVVTKGRYDQKICEVEIDNTFRWTSKHWESIKLSYSRAPYFKKYYDFFEDLYSSNWQKLMDLNVHIIQYLVRCLDIKTNIYFESDLKTGGISTERIIEICKRLRAKVYLSGAGGKDYLDEQRFVQEGIQLKYQHFEHPVYTQLHDKFEPYMSVIDLLFNYGDESSKVIRGNKT